MSNEQNIGTYLRAHRGTLTALELAEQLTGYQAYDVSKWERMTRPLPINAAHQIAKVFAEIGGQYDAHVANLVRLTAIAFPRESKRVATA
jgi:hypothetical protein